MKKKLKSTLILILIMVFFAPQAVHANMASPSKSDIGSSVTFEKNGVISVVSEVLDITVDGAEADIFVTYRMKNTTNESISTQSMFLSPNIENSNTELLVNGKSIEYVADSYSLNYSTDISTDNWQYVVLVDEEIAIENNDKTVDTISFQMDFAPNEEYDVVVSYCYRLGGYPDYDFNVKRGEIEYYLAPAAMWKDFSSLTINLYLDEDMPIIKSSNLEFEKIDTRTYQYVSDTLPEENLEIVIDENGWQNIFSTIRSPYLPFTLLMFSPIILIVLVVITFVVWRLHQKKKIS